MKSKHVFSLVLVMVLALSLPVSAKQIGTILGGPLDVMGYISQGVTFSLTDEHYDTEDDIQSAVTTLFMESKWNPNRELNVYVSGKFSADWVYDLKNDDRSWSDKQFNKSRDRHNIDDESWQLLHEAHLSYMPGQFLFRIGKQIVSWGQMDSIRLMDQINPIDQRRGFADVEFETTIIPIWLLRSEYGMTFGSEWISDVSFQFIFNPNADFIPDQEILLGNDAGGIWAPKVNFPGLRVGSTRDIVDEPDEWSDEGFEYGVKIETTIRDSILTLNGFYGRSNTPVFINSAPPDMSMAYDGVPLLHLNRAGYYPRFKFIGATFTSEVPFLRPPFLGGLTPVVRMESFYAFDSTFASNLNAFEEYDELRTGIGFDWKIKLNFLNPKAYFSVLPQVFYFKIFDYPSYGLGKEEGTTQTTLVINTSYMNAKLKPQMVWLRDWDSESNMYIPSISYAMTNNWEFTITGTLFDGEKEGHGLEVFENKDQISFKIEYRWD